MKKAILFLIITMFLLMSGCLSPESQKKESFNPEQSPDEMMEPTPEAVETRAPVFTYDDKQIDPSNFPSEITLRFSDEPVVFSNKGYIRLAGIVGEKDPMAILEISGKGESKKAGESVGDYFVQSISNDCVKLKKKIKPNV